MIINSWICGYIIPRANKMRIKSTQLGFYPRTLWPDVYNPLCIPIFAGNFLSSPQYNKLGNFRLRFVPLKLYQKHCNKNDKFGPNATTFVN